MNKVVNKQIRPWMFRKELIVLYYGLRDKRTSVIAKIPAVLSVLYLLSPIDLIPDFIPFLGYVDDIVIIPLLMNLSIRLLPAIVEATRSRRYSGRHLRRSGSGTKQCHHLWSR